MKFKSSEHFEEKYCKWCWYAGYKSKLRTHYCEAYNSRKYMERLDRRETNTPQWQCRKCGVPILVLWDKPSVTILGKIRSS